MKKIGSCFPGGRAYAEPCVLRVLLLQQSTRYERAPMEGREVDGEM